MKAALITPQYREWKRKCAIITSRHRGYMPSVLYNWARDRPLAWHLAILCFALVLPILGLATVFVWTYAGTERDRIEQQALRMAREVVAVTDRELAGLVATTEVLSLSRLLQQGDLDLFDAQAREVYRRLGINVVLRDLNSRQLVNTRVPPGTPLPTNVDTESDQVALTTNRPVISNLFVGGVTRKLLFVVNVPVIWNDGKVKYFLNLSLEPDRIRRIISEADQPAGWAAMVTDRRGLVIAHSNQHEEMLGKQVPRHIWGEQSPREGIMAGEDLISRRVPVLFFYSRSLFSGWVAIVTVPANQISAPLRYSITGLTGAAAIILFASLGLAVAFSRRIAASVNDLAAQSRLGRGDQIQPLSTPVREVNALSLVLSSASKERSAAESALRTSEERYRALSSATREGIALQERCRIIEANDAFVAMFGRTSAQEIIGQRSLSVIAPTARKAILASWRRNSPDPFEGIGQRADGSLFPIELSCKPITYHGRAVQVVIIRDLSAQKGVEAAVRENVARLKLAQAAGRVGTWDWDIVNNRAICSETYCQLYGLDPKGSGHQSSDAWLAQVHPDDRDRVMRNREAALISGHLENEYRIIRTDGAVRWVVDRAIGIFSPEGRLTRFIGANVDVTETRAAAERLRELQAELLHASRLSAMGQIAAALAHELNQPLGAATNFIGSARLVLRAAGPDSGTRALARLEKAAEQTVRAGAILSRLRNFVARSETETRIVSAREMITDAVSLALVGVRDPNLRVNTRIDDEQKVVVDPIQIQQVIFNLLKNSLEATEGRKPREIELSMHSIPGAYVEISVSDNGPGLPAEPGQLFEPFATTKPQGMGVGLSICRSIIEAHHGRLWAEVRPGGGAIFHFTIPAARTEGIDG